MNLETAREFLLWCTLFNYAALLLWFLAFRLMHDGLYRLHSRWFRISPERFDTLHYAGMAVYKIGVLLFNLIPYFALRIVG